MENSVNVLRHTKRERSRRRAGQQTAFISLDTHRCRACWRCVDACPERVIGKINIIIHKHAVIAHRDRCTGCGKCIKSCEYTAINRLEKTKGARD